MDTSNPAIKNWNCTRVYLVSLVRGLRTQSTESKSGNNTKHFYRSHRISIGIEPLTAKSSTKLFVRFQSATSRVQNWGPVRDSGARSIEGVFL